MNLRRVGFPTAIGASIALSIAFCLWLLSDSVVSNEIAFPGGKGRLRVVRTERWIFGPDDGPVEARWMLQERRPDGDRRDTQIGRNDGPGEGLRRIRYELSWTEPGRVLVCRAREAPDVSVYFLGPERALLPNWRPVPPPVPPGPVSADVARRVETLKVKRPQQEIRIEGEHYGSNSRDFAVEDPEVVLVLGPRFGTHGSTVSKGPVVLLGEAHLMGPVVSESWILLADRSFPRGQVVAPAIYVRGTPILSQARLSPDPFAPAVSGRR